MNIAKVAEYLVSTWGGVSGMVTVVPGGLSQERTTSTNKPYARFRLTEEQVVYLSEQAVAVVYGFQAEVFADNPGAVDLENIDVKLEAFVAALTAGATVSSSLAGKLVYAWRVPPAGQSLQTEDERRAAVDVTVQRLGLRARVQWY